MEAAHLTNLSTPMLTTPATSAIVPNMADPFYEYFHGVGFSPMLLLYYTPSLLCATIAIVCNCSLLLVTIKTRNLHNSFNILIALDSFASAMFEITYITPFFVALFGINYIGSMPCYFISVPGVFGINTTLTSMLYVGLERLCSLIFPFWTNQMSPTMSKVFLLIGFAITNVYWIYYAVIIYQGTINDMRNMEVRCTMGDNWPDWVIAINYRNNLMLLGAIFSVYSILGLYMLWAMWRKTQISANNWHIIKAVAVIMALILAGYVINGTSIYYLPALHLNALQILVASSILTDVTILVSGSNGPVLYMFSVDYRRAYKKEIKSLFFGYSPSSSNMVASIPHVSRHRMVHSYSHNPSANIHF